METHRHVDAKNPLPSSINFTVDDDECEECDDDKELGSHVFSLEDMME